MESLWDEQTSEEWQSRLRILNERVDDVATKTSSMLAKSCSLNDASKGLKDQGRRAGVDKMHSDLRCSLVC